MMKCYSKLTYTMAAMSDLDFGFRIAGLAQEYGVHGYTTPQVIAFALELYEAGILTDQDMQDFRLVTRRDSSGCLTELFGEKELEMF